MEVLNNDITSIVLKLDKFEFGVVVTCLREAAGVKNLEAKIGASRGVVEQMEELERQPASELGSLYQRIQHARLHGCHELRLVTQERRLIDQHLTRCAPRATTGAA